MIFDKLYVEFLDFYSSIQDEYSDCGFSESEWETFHLKFLLYYIVRYKISNMSDFISYHYFTSYRLYLMQFLPVHDLRYC